MGSEQKDQRPGPEQAELKSKGLVSRETLMPKRAAATKPGHGDVLTTISNGLVALLKEYYGKGPTEARTYYHDDLVVCLLRGGLTRVEKTLQESGRTEAVIHQRIAFQEVMRQRFESVVERATHRQVIGFMSGYQQDPDMICEVFILAPTDLVDDDELPQPPPHLVG